MHDRGRLLGNDYRIRMNVIVENEVNAFPSCAAA